MGGIHWQVAGDIVRAPFAGIGDQIFQETGDVGLICVGTCAKESQLPLGCIHPADHLGVAGVLRVIVAIANILLYGGRDAVDQIS